MSWLRSFERLAEEVVEGSARRLFRPPLHPIQIARAAARALAESETVGPGGTRVANAYTVLLSSSDFLRFARYRRSLAEQVRGYLDRYASDRGLAPAAPWRVEIEMDRALRRGAVRVASAFEDPRTPAELSAPDEPLEQTRRLVVALPSPPRSSPPAWIELESGERVVLRHDVTSIGRALENTVVIADTRISRHHAQLERTAEGYLVRDLASTNGVQVAGLPVSEARLRDGEEISLGGFRLRFRQPVEG